MVRTTFFWGSLAVLAMTITLALPLPRLAVAQPERLLEIEAELGSAAEKTGR
jgi:hypothetical protein